MNTMIFGMPVVTFCIIFGIPLLIAGALVLWGIKYSEHHESNGT